MVHPQAENGTECKTVGRAEIAVWKIGFHTHYRLKISILGQIMCTLPTLRHSIGLFLLRNLNPDFNHTLNLT